MLRTSIGFSFIVLGVLTTGCSSLFTKPQTNTYVDSAADLTNHAPASMSVPADAASGETIDPTYLRTQADYHFTLADSYSLEGNSARAIEEYKLTLVYDTKSPVVRLRLAAEYVKQGLVNEAIDQAKLAIAMDPKYEDGHLLLGGLYSALKMYDDALKCYRTVIDLNPENTEAPLFIGALLAEQKKYAEATKYFEGLTARGGGKSLHLAHYYLGRVRAEDGQMTKAETSYREALKVKPAFPDAVLALGQVLEGKKKRAEAVKLYAQYQDKHGPDAVVADALSKIYLEDENFEAAARQLEVIEASDSENLNVRVKLAFILIENKRYNEAILKLEEILSKAPYSDKIRFYLGAVYEELKDYKNAITHFLKVPIGSSYYAESVIHASYLYKLLEDYDKAIEVVQTGIQNKDDNPQMYTLYASFLDDKKMYPQAVELLGRAIKKFPDHPQLNFYLGSMYERTGNVKGSIESMKRVLQLDSQHVQALNFLAFTYAENNMELEKAESLARQALELQPNDAYIMDTLGWVLFKKGQTSDAIKVLEAAFKLQSTEGVIAEHLGDAYYKNQMPEKAKKMYHRAKELEANAENAEKIRSKIVAVDRQIQEIESLSSSSRADRRPASEPNAP